MGQDSDAYTRVLQRRLRERLGERRYGEVFDAILANLEVYGAAGGAGLTDSDMARVLRVPEAKLDEETRRLLAELLDHVLRQVTGAAKQR